MNESKENKKLDKKPNTRVVWPLKKFINKFFVYNLFLTLGIAMLIASAVCMDAFNGEQSKVIGNFVVSAIVTFAGFAGGCTYSILLTKKGEEPLEQRFANLTKWFFWVPILGSVFDKIWKSKEKKLNYALKLKENPNFKKPRMAFPSSIVIIFGALVAIVFLVWLLYVAGVVKPDPALGQTIPGLLDIFLNPIRGFAGYTKPGTDIFVNGVASIAIFLLLFNGAMTLVNESRAIEAGVGGLLRKMKGKEIILIPILMFILAICGSTFNMCEQLLPLFLVIIPIMFAAGYDAMTGFLLVFLSAGVGVMASTVNPVLIGIAVSSLKGVDIQIGMMDGIVWRLVMFVVLITVSITCTMLYARKVKKHPMKSCVYMSQEQFKEKYTFDKDALPPMTTKRKWSLIVFGIAFLMLIIGFVDWQAICGFDGFQIAHDWLLTNFPFITSIDPLGKWGMVEAGFLFFIAAVIIGAINWKGCGHFISTLYAGCKEFIGVAFILAVGKGLAITLTDSGLNNVIAKGLGGVLGQMPAVGAMLLIFLVITLLTVFIPSCSALSSAMFPVIGPAVQAAGASTISMSGTVTTFAAAMGWMNLITPACMVLPFLEVSKMDLGEYYKSAWKQLVILLLVCLTLLAIGCYLPASMF